MLRLPHSVGVGDGGAVVVGVGHFLVLGLPPHFAAQMVAALLRHLHFYGAAM